MIKKLAVITTIAITTINLIFYSTVSLSMIFILFAYNFISHRLVQFKKLMNYIKIKDKNTFNPLIFTVDNLGYLNSYKIIINYSPSGLYLAVFNLGFNI